MAITLQPAPRAVHVYEPVARPPVAGYLRDAWSRRALAWELSSAEIRAQHLNTVFGRLWLVINPLLLAAVYLLLVDILRRGERPPGMFAHLLAGVFAYQLISDAMRRGVRSIVDSRPLILNASFPRVLLPAGAVVTAFRRFLPTVVIYLPVHVLAGRPVGWQLLWMMPLLGLLLAFASGMALFLAAAQVYFRDLRELLPYFLRVLLFISPILYLPTDARASYGFVLDLNPVGQTLTAWSDVLYGGMAPTAHSLLVSSAWALAAVAAGTWLFLSRDREFAVRL